MTGLADGALPAFDAQRRLAGRRLAFHGGWRGGGSGSEPEGWTHVRFKFARGNDMAGMRPAPFEIAVVLRTPEPMDESVRRGWRGRGADWTVEGIVEEPGNLGAGAAFTLIDAVVK